MEGQGEGVARFSPLSKARKTLLSNFSRHKETNYFSLGVFLSLLYSSVAFYGEETVGLLSSAMWRSMYAN